ncbi:MAG: hypothetical protein F6J87_02615 [Spirulina sp. SIO3F2]|nr:hypothetical protein [Spirulina sp. SIO3F2]
MLLNLFGSTPQPAQNHSDTPPEIATVVTKIDAEKIGQVLYQGGYYRAYCITPYITLCEEAKVVVERFNKKTLTLLVNPYVSTKFPVDTSQLA